MMNKNNKLINFFTKKIKLIDKDGVKLCLI